MNYNIEELREIWNKVPEHGGIRTRLFDDVFSSHSHYSHRTTLKKFLIDTKIIKDVCCICGLTDWQGNSITLQLDHIDGDRHNNQIHNLRLLCPNCHSQTETYGSKSCNVSNDTYRSDVDFIDAIKTSDNARQALIKLGLQAFGGNYDRIRKIKENNVIEFASSNKKKKPPLNELLECICKYSIKHIGELYTVSDNAVRKWMKSYNIPVNRNELRKFINDSGYEYDVKWRIDLNNIKKGESSKQSKLTDIDVCRIREMHINGHSQRSIAKQFNVSKATISSLLNGRSWIHVK